MAAARQGGPGDGPKPYSGVGGWHCPRLWPDSVIVCIAGGPSLTVDDVELVRSYAANAGGSRADLRVVCINDAIRLAPWADVAYAADTSWWRQVGSRVDTGALKISCQDTEFRDVRVLRYRPGPVVETDPHWIATGRQPGPNGVMHGGNSGYQAVNVAKHLGGRRIVLLAYDMGAGEDGQVHWFGSHPPGLNNPRPEHFDTWAKAFARLAPVMADLGVEVVNCSRRTALDCFPRVPLEEVLAWP